MALHTSGSVTADTYSELSLSTSAAGAMIAARSSSAKPSSCADRAAFARYGVFDAYRASKAGHALEFSIALCLQATEKQPVVFTGKTVLDIACGQRNLFFAQRMENADRIIGIDIERESIRRNPVIDAGIVGEIDAIPLRDCSVDVIVSTDTIEHSEHPDRFLSECWRVLRPGGRACFTTPYKYGFKTFIAHYGGKFLFDLLWRKFKGTTLPYDSLYRANSVTVVRKLARQTGFRVLKITPAAELTHFFYPFPIVFAASRLWDRALEMLGLQRFWNYMAYTLEKPEL